MKKVILNGVINPEFKTARPQGITYRHVLAAALYVFCDPGCESYGEEDDFFYEYLHFKFLKRYGLHSVD